MWPPIPSHPSSPHAASRSLFFGALRASQISGTPHAMSETSRALLELRPQESGPVSERLYAQGMQSKRARTHLPTRPPAFGP